MAGTPFYVKQIFWVLIGLTLMVALAFVEYRFYSDFAYLVYAIASVLLLLVLVYGIITSGAQRWVRIGSLSFQPSEFVKIAFIFALAKFFHRPPDREGYSLKQLPLPFLLLLLPMVLILKQPDLGTAIILLLVFFSILIFVKIRWSSLHSPSDWLEPLPCRFFGISLRDGHVVHFFIYVAVKQRIAC